MTRLHASALLAAGVALGLAGGWLLWHTTPAAAAVAIADSAHVDVAQLDTAETERHQLDTAAAAALAAARTRARRAEDSAAVAGHAAELATQRAQELARRLVTDSTQRDSLVHAIAAADTARQEQLANVTTALEATRAALVVTEARRAAADSAAQRAQLLLHQNLARLDEVTRMTRSRPIWRQVLTAAGCAAAGVGAAKGNAALGLGGGAVCAGSLALR